MTAPRPLLGTSVKRIDRTRSEGGHYEAGHYSPTEETTYQCTNTARPSVWAWLMKATHRSRWLSKSVSGLSSAGTKRLRKPSNPAPALKPGSESTVNRAEMPASFKCGSVTAPPHPGTAQAALPASARLSWLRSRSEPRVRSHGSGPALPTWRRPEVRRLPALPPSTGRLEHPSPRPSCLGDSAAPSAD